MMDKKKRRFGLVQRTLFFILLFCAGCSGGGGDGSTSEKTLVPAFSISPGSGNAPLNAYFDASSSVSAGESITEYAWDFGDGTTGSGSMISHTYTLEGTYTVVLTLTGSSSGSVSVSKNIVVNPSPPSSTVSGKIIISSGNLMDTDTNDPNSPVKENNTFGTAQQISSPATLGGYVNEPGSGAMGRSFIAGDQSDIYSVYLTGNETISLSFDNPFLNDLDLYLYNDSFEIVNSSKDVAGIETLRVDKSGNYYIRVYAYGGASSYVLILGQNIAQVEGSGMTLNEDFVPGEAIVGFKKPKETASYSASQEGMEVVEPVLVKFEASYRHSINTLMSIVEKGNMKTALLIPGASETLLEKDRTLNMLKALKTRDDVVYAEPNFIRRAVATVPSDPHYIHQWNYPLINLPQAWDTSTGDSDVVVAVIDTGVLLAHPDMKNRLTVGYDFISRPDNALDGDGIDSNPDDPGDKSNGSTSSFHGTHVAGTVGAATNNFLGVSGVSWNSMIMPLRVLGRDGGSSYDIIQALKYAAGLSNDSGTVPQKRAEIINMSFGSPGYSQSEYNIISTLKDLGILIVAAAGNDYSSQQFYPAAYPGVFAVSAVTMEKKAAWYTNYGPWIDIAAPGGDSSEDINGDGFPDGVLSTCGDDSSGKIEFLYTFLQGTSMSTAHVSGVFALMKSIYPGLDTDIVTNLLGKNSLTDDTGSSGRDDFHGNGLINAQKCLAAATELAQGIQISHQPILGVTPGAINFGSTAESLILTALNGGDGDLFMDPPVSSIFWLTISPEKTDSGNLGSYLVTADRSSLQENTSYSGTITLTSSANSISIPVTIYQPGAESSGGDLGAHYIQIVNTETNEISQAVENAENGEYTFLFTDLPAGIYRIYAGNDPDNDGFILGSWEASGGYKTVETPTLIYVNSDVSGIEFFTGYNFAISASSLASPSQTGRQTGIKKIVKP